MEREDTDAKVIRHQKGRWRACALVEEQTFTDMKMKVCTGEERSPGIYSRSLLNQSLRNPQIFAVTISTIYHH